MNYTNEQRAAIEHAGGHSLTYAVAGSGKTQMLIGRVRFLLEQGTPAERIRVLTFNKSAATELEERLARDLPPGLAAPQVSTFHSLGLELVLRFEQDGLLGRRRLEEGDLLEKKLAREAAMQALEDTETGRYPSQDELEALRAFIGRVKADILPARAAYRTLGIEARYDWFPMAFDYFERARERAGVRFFADLLSEPVAVMRTNPEARRMVANRLDVVVVDEFQDVSRIQVELLRDLMGTRAKLNAVGDDSQCIYAWRGSRPEYMGKDFDRYFPNATRYTLSRSFRFGHRVSLAAALLIDRNENRVDTLCVSAPGTPETAIDIVRAGAVGDLAAVADAIADWRRAGRRLDECAVLTRLWAQTLGLELALIERGIPYRKPRGHIFAVREVIGLLGWLRLAAGSLFGDRRAPGFLRAMLATPTLWIPAAAVGELADALVREPERAVELMHERANRTRRSYSAGKLRERADLFAEVPTWGDLTAAEVLQRYASRTSLSAVFGRAVSSQAASEKELAYRTVLGWALRDGSGLRDFIERMDGLRLARHGLETAAANGEGGGSADGDSEEVGGVEDTGPDAVSLLTIHQAKGLEWPFVVVAGLEAGQFPNSRADVEEERRLAYVAITRAKERLTLAVPADPRFDPAWAGEASVPPVGLPKGAAPRAASAGFGAASKAAGPAVVQSGARAWASRFAFECEPRTAAALGGAIADRLSGRNPDAPLPPAPDSPQAVKILNRYLSEVGIAERYAPPAEPEPEPQPERPWAENDRVRHKVFGEGRVVRLVDKDILEIDFRVGRRAIKLGVVPLERVA